MVLTGKLTFNSIAVKTINVDKVVESQLIIQEEKASMANNFDRIDEYEDHPFQGEVVGVGSSVTTCKEGDIVLFKLSTMWTPTPYILNDKGTIYFIYNEGDVALVREKE